MKTCLLTPVVLLMMVAALGSCVGKKKFVASENGRLSAEEQVQAMSSTIESQNKMLAGLETDTSRQGRQIRELQRLLTSNMSQQEKMDALLKSQSGDLAERERTINDLKAIIQKQNDMVNGLLTQVTDALIGFSSDELTVQMRDGKVYVAMSDKLLFKSGSADVDKRGKEALALLADVLTKQPEIDIFIEGHTDNIPIKTSRFTDNWDLSVLRATSVVRILTTEYRVNPTQIIPSGRSQYFPVADNATADGRSKNRRTEIILSPKLDKLFKMLSEYQTI
ncbi:MAG: OmpA family protein [Bacteroidales bacterium]|nr:OmpA family protein [Bacteroidales bacterium]